MVGSGMIVTPEQMSKLNRVYDVAIPLLATDWIGSTAPYTIKVNWAGMTDRDMPEIWLTPTGNTPTDAELETARLITPSTENGYLLFSANVKPETSITARVTGVPISGEFTAANMASLVAKVDQLGAKVDQLGTGTSDISVKEYGMVSFSNIKANEDSYIEETFAGNYNSIPIVIATIQETSGTNVSVFCRNITDSGCKIYVRNNSSATVSYVYVGYIVVDL